MAKGPDPAAPRRLAGQRRPRPDPRPPPRTWPDKTQPWIGLVGGFAAIVALGPSVYSSAKAAWFPTPTPPVERSAELQLTRKSVGVSRQVVDISPASKIRFLLVSRVQLVTTFRITIRGYPGMTLKLESSAICSGDLFGTREETSRSFTHTDPISVDAAVKSQVITVRANSLEDHDPVHKETTGPQAGGVSIEIVGSPQVTVKTWLCDMDVRLEAPSGEVIAEAAQEPAIQVPVNYVTTQSLTPQQIQSMAAASPIPSP
jgi:hypothetical protein